jgi:hypothetical protein
MKSKWKIKYEYEYRCNFIMILDDRENINNNSLFYRSFVDAQPNPCISKINNSQRSKSYIFLIIVALIVFTLSAAAIFCL